MSVDNIVIIKKEKMITPAKWQQAILEAGFDLQLDIDFDISEFMGFLPCVYRGEDTGFEYSFDELEDDWLEEDYLEQIGNRDYALTLTTHGDFEELLAATIAASVLCSITDGILLECGEPPFISSVDALQFASEQEKSFDDNLNG